MSGQAGDLTLMTEVQARAALSGRPVHISVLAPVGAWLGVGRLRVLRATEEAGTMNLVCGYEAYAPFDKLRVTHDGAHRGTHDGAWRGAHDRAG
jgi:hypothetical protein